MLHTFNAAKLKRPDNPAIPLNQNMGLFLEPQDPELLSEDISYVEYISKLRKKPKKKFQQPPPQRKEHQHQNQHHNKHQQPQVNDLDIYIPKSTFHTFYYKDPSGIFNLI